MSDPSGRSGRVITAALSGKLLTGRCARPAAELGLMCVKTHSRSPSRPPGLLDARVGRDGYQTVWVRDWSRRPGASARLLCLPPAGAGANLYRSWGARLPDELAVLAVELPGHGSRAQEPPLTDIADLLTAELSGELAALDDLPLVIFGFSMGGLLGLAIGRALARNGSPPALLVTAACEGPADAVSAWTGEPSDADILAMVRRHGGTPEELLTSPDYVSYLIPLVRADLALSVTAAAPGEPLSCPIRGYLGAQDRSLEPAATDSWAHCTTGGFERRTFPGGHFFIQEHPGQVLAQLVTDIDDALTADRAGRR